MILEPCRGWYTALRFTARHLSFARADFLVVRTYTFENASRVRCAQAMTANSDNNLTHRTTQFTLTVVFPIQHLIGNLILNLEPT